MNNIVLNGDTFLLCGRYQPVWRGGGGPRIQHDESIFSPSCTVPSHRLFILSANSRASLMAMIQDHLDWVQQQP